MNQLFAPVEALDEVVWDAQATEGGKDVFANAIVKNAFAQQCRFFLRVKGRRVIFKILNDGAWFRPFVQYFCFAFVYLSASVHEG